MSKHIYKYEGEWHTTEVKQTGRGWTITTTSRVQGEVTDRKVLIYKECFMHLWDRPLTEVSQQTGMENWRRLALHATYEHSKMMRKGHVVQ